MKVKEKDMGEKDKVSLAYTFVFLMSPRLKEDSPVECSDAYTFATSPTS